MNTFKIPYLLKLFPDAKFINIYRDGRAEVFSYFKKIHNRLVNFEEVYKKNGYYLNKEELYDVMAKFWVMSLKEVEKQKDELHLYNKFYEVSYENFCRDPKNELDKLYNFLDLDKSRSGIKKIPEIKNMNYKYKDGLSKKQLKSITEIMAETLKAKGYKL
jgi:hypothetical protein